MYAELLHASALAPSWGNYVLPKSIAAIQVISAPEEGGAARLGLIAQLPEGAEIQMGGAGFSEATIKVLCRGAAYFIFLEDLESAREEARAAAV